MIQLFNIYWSQVFPKKKIITGKLIKKPRRGKKVLPQTNTQYSKEKKYIYTSTEIKLEICCIPRSWDGSTLQSFWSDRSSVVDDISIREPRGPLAGWHVDQVAER